MAESADAVVVGAGILGASAAAHLLEAGVSDVLLLERDGVGQATSSAGAGFVGLWAGGYLPAWKDEELEVERYGLDFYRRLADDGYEFGYKQNGNLWAATNDEAWQAFVERIASHEGVPERKVLSPEEVEEVTGIIPARGVVGGVLFPNGCQVSAPKASEAVAARFAGRGGRVDVRRPVERIVVESGRVVAVETQRGRVDTGIVVLAAGAWTNGLLGQLGIWAPMVPLVQSRIVTEPLGVPPTMPTLMLQEFSFIWLREENGGLLWGSTYEEAPRLAFLEQAPPDRFDNLPLDGVFKVQRDGLEASKAIPVLARYRSMTVAQGAPCYTADLRGLLGPVPELEGLYVLGGCNEAGITHGPGWGKLLAELIVDGSASLTDSEVFRLDRFGEQCRTGADVVAGMDEVVGSIFAGSTV
jgi:sarcosine oxidase, subunit beta